MKLFLLLSILYVFTEVNSWRTFHNGRMVGGNVRKPKIDTRKSVRDIKEEWFTQVLDHANPTDQTTWQQRYFSNDEYYDAERGGPVFLMIGGEGEASILWMNNGVWYDDAAKYGALMFQVEHRYYGESHPTEDLSTENLKYLTSEQALADLATFIVAMNKKYNLPEDVKWIVNGGSYSGNLAAWVRFKYPHLIHGASSSSGPVLAKVDFLEYFRVVRESLGTHSDECVTAVTDGFETIGVLLKDAIGQSNLDQVFNLCYPIEEFLQSPLDIGTFYQSIADNFAGVVQYNEIGGAEGQITINVLCDIMVNESAGAPIIRLGQVNQLLLDSYEEPCLDYIYAELIEYLKEESWDSDAAEGSRQWTYQTCTEFGYYQTSTDEPHTFGDQFPLDIYIQMCKDTFGDIYDGDFLDSAILRSNTIYGGLDIEVSNVVFVHGTIDPWHALGITESINPAAPAILINGTAHCANMYSAADYDPPQLTAARDRVTEIIGSWLSS